eukprot:5176618-Pyramimonas_sp.AAC.1
MASVYPPAHGVARSRGWAGVPIDAEGVWDSHCEAKVPMQVPYRFIKLRYRGSPSYRTEDLIPLVLGGGATCAVSGARLRLPKRVRHGIVLPPPIRFHARGKFGPASRRVSSSQGIATAALHRAWGRSPALYSCRFC